MVVTDLKIPFLLVKVNYGYILKFLWESLLPPALSVSLPWVVPQPYRPRQELHLHLRALPDDSC